MEIRNFLQILWILRDARVYRHIATHHLNFTFSSLRSEFDTLLQSFLLSTPLQ